MLTSAPLPRETLRWPSMLKTFVLPTSMEMGLKSAVCFMATSRAWMAICGMGTVLGSLPLQRQHRLFFILPKVSRPKLMQPNKAGPLNW